VEDLFDETGFAFDGAFPPEEISTKSIGIGFEEFRCDRL
jgi:hypothetical protein